MGIIIEKVTERWNKNNKIHYESKGYLFTNYKDEFIVDIKDLTKWSNVKLTARCDECGEYHTVLYYGYKNKKHTFYSNNGDYLCPKCVSIHRSEKQRFERLKNSITFEQWCINNDKNEFLERWDYDKNQYTPSQVAYKSNLKFYFKCDNCNEHISEQRSICNVTKYCKIVCSQCNSLYFKRPDLISYIVDIEESKNHSYCSNSRIRVKCPFCGYESQITISGLTFQGFHCQVCGDNKSYPSKIISNLLKQLNVNFISEYTPQWVLGKRYDFYFELEEKYIIEVDGNFHYVDNTLSGQTKEQSQFIDDEKNKLAEENGIHMIRVECRKSNLQYIKNSILHTQQMTELFDLSYINWEECNEYAITSLQKTAADMWMMGYNLKEIKIFTNLSLTTIRRYLKNCADCGLCNYDPMVEKEKNYKNKVCRKIICINTNEIFDSVYKASDKYNIAENSIRQNVRGEYTYSGKLNTGEKLHWMYYEDWLKENSRQELLKIAI